jgi:D-serine deaminase-like pyridoxal phosphate-dependent protein
MKNLIIVPSLLLDEEICRKNISFMAEKARRNNVQFRPHFKTHVSQEIGKWFRDIGVDKITVSSLSMAEYFAGDHWNDITVAFPVNILETDKINRLSKAVRLNILIESVESVELLEQDLQNDVGVFIKIDVGSHRTGIAYNNLALIEKVLGAADNSVHARFKGFLCHAGHSYDAKSLEEIKVIHHDSNGRLMNLKQHYADRYPNMVISTGDTPTCSLMEDFSGVDEIRPGNFVFYDLMQNRIGSCTAGQIAVAMACPVVAIHKERNEMVIYGGAVHFSKERLESNETGPIYGVAAENSGEGWGNPVEGMYLTKLSQEHGIVKVPRNLIDNYHIGDIIKIFPIHSCLTSHLMKKYITTQGKIISRL